MSKKAKLASDVKSKKTKEVSNDVCHNHVCPYCGLCYDHKFAPSCRFKGLAYRACDRCYFLNLYIHPGFQENDGTRPSKVQYPKDIFYFVFLGELL
jgi:hypothetical protein